MQKLAEDELPESKCGFWKGRSCADVIFVNGHLVKKSWEHRARALFTFINLKKAYNSVLREALQIAMAIMGIPEGTIHLIKSFQQDMKENINGWRDQSPEWAQTGLLHGTCVVQSLHLPGSGEMAGES